MLKISKTFLTCTSAIALATSASAQDAGSDPTLGEIVVTAQKRSENVHDVTP